MSVGFKCQKAHDFSILAHKIKGQEILSFAFSRWDNGETEKMSPWDFEPLLSDRK